MSFEQGCYSESGSTGTLVDALLEYQKQCQLDIKTKKMVFIGPAAYQTELQEAIWLRLKQHLVAAAPRFMKFASAQDVLRGRQGYDGGHNTCSPTPAEAIAMHVFSLLINELPRIQVDPDATTDSVHNLFFTIGYRRMIDEERRWSGRTSESRKEDEAATTPINASDVLAPARPSSKMVRQPLPLVEEITGLRVSHFEEHLIDGLFTQELRTQAHTYLQKKLDAKQLAIVEARFFSSERETYGQIAQRHPGWSEGAVKMLCGRTAREMRQHLVKTGWLDPPD